MTATIAFVDTETTGFDADRHQVWEVALIRRHTTEHGTSDTEFTWQLPVDLGRADPEALTVARFYERAVQAKRLITDPFDESSPGEFADQFARLTHGAVIVGSNPSFDTAFLERLLRRNGACPGWHYRSVDVATLAAGWLTATRPGSAALSEPWSSSRLSAAVGVDVDAYEKHTALGDARWARDLYDRVTAGHHGDGSGAT